MAIPKAQPAQSTESGWTESDLQQRASPTVEDFQIAKHLDAFRKLVTSAVTELRANGYHPLMAAWLFRNYADAIENGGDIPKLVDEMLVRADTLSEKANRDELAARMKKAGVKSSNRAMKHDIHDARDRLAEPLPRAPVFIDKMLPLIDAARKDAALADRLFENGFIQQLASEMEPFYKMLRAWGRLQVLSLVDPAEEHLGGPRLVLRDSDCIPDDDE